MNNTDIKKRYNHLYYLKNRERLIGQVKKYYKKNRLRKILYWKKYQKEHPERVISSRRKYYLSNRDYVLSKSKERHIKYKELRNKQCRNYYRTHKNESLIRSKEYNSNRIKKDQKFRKRILLGMCLSYAIHHYAKTGKIAKSKNKSINYSRIISHLSPFPKEISKYHVDHIIPLSKFDLTKQKEVKVAFAPENHQWLLAKDNISKGNRGRLI